MSEMHTYTELMRRLEAILSGDDDSGSGGHDGAVREGHFGYIHLVDLKATLMSCAALGSNLKSRELLALVDSGTYVARLTSALERGCWLRGDGGCAESVASLLDQQPPSPPKQVSASIVAVEAELENKSVERLLYSAVVGGREYLATADPTLVTTMDLQAAIEAV